MTFILVYWSPESADPTWYQVDTEEQRAIAKDAMRQNSMTKAYVYAGDPEDTSYKNGQILRAE